MKISVIGCGYLGAVHAACMAKLGHDVVGFDVDTAKVEALAAGKAPFFEPGLDELLAEAWRPAAAVHHRPGRAGRLRGALRLRRHPAEARRERRRPDLRQRRGRGAAAAPAPRRPRRRQVHRAGRHRRAARRTGRRGRARTRPLAWNPEFLREGFAVEDTLHPDRLVYGVPPGAERRAERAMLDEVYAAPLATGTPLVVTDLAHRRAGQGRGQLLPRHQDLASSTPWPRSARPPAPTSSRSPTRSATTTASAASSSTPGSASAAAACPRTSGPSWPGPASWASTRR